MFGIWRGCLSNAVVGQRVTEFAESISTSPGSGKKPTIWTFFAVTTDMLVTIHLEYVNSAPMS